MSAVVVAIVATQPIGLDNVPGAGAIAVVMAATTIASVIEAPFAGQSLCQHVVHG